MLRRLVLLSLIAVACGPAQNIGDAGGDGGGEGTGGGNATGTGGGTGTGTGGGSSIRKITTLTVTPATLTLKVGAVGGATAMAMFDDGTTADVSGSVEWIATPTGIVDIDINNGLAGITAKATGTSTVTAKTGALVSNALTVTVSGSTMTDGGVVVTPNQEVRAVWVTRFAWTTEADVKGVIDRSAAAGFNVVYFQIRGNGDAYYKSTLAPWAKKLTGTLGKDPGWDPLQVAIDQAHLRGIQLHAYWNVHAAWPVPAGCATTSCTCQPTQGLSDSCVLPEASFAGAPEHFLRQHPEVMAVNAAGKSIDGEYYWFSAGDPLVKAHVLAVANELLMKYAVDGLHLDRVRYPGQVYSFDPGSNAAFAALPAPKPTREDWQRKNVTETVGEIYAAMKLHRPKAVLSASVWGIYKPLPGCSTSQGYGNYFQDSVQWIKEGKIDALTPMIYWDIGSGCTDWAKLLDGFMAGSNGRHIVAGMHGLDANMVKPDRIKARIAYARQVGAAGTSIFASTYLEQNASTGAQAWTTFKGDGGVYEQDAGWPAMSWRP